MSVATYRRPGDIAITSDATAREWMRRVDAASQVFERRLGWFAPHQITIGSPVPDMAVELEPGHIWRPALAGGVSIVTEVGRQTVSGFTTPSAGTHRIDRVVVDAITGVATRVAGTPVSGSPTATPPAIPAGKLPVCQVLLIDSSTYIADRMITDERAFRRNIVGAADFDGTNDFLQLGADLTGNQDSKSGILSCWVRFDAGTGEQRVIASGGSSGQGFESQRRTSSGAFEIIGRNAAQTDILLLRTGATFAAGATWWHFLASWDLALGVGHLYVNDVSDLAASTLTDDTIDYAEDNYGVGANPLSGAVKLNGCLAELYFAPGRYIDLSVTTNRRKFISASGRPVWLGHNGARPTGTAPILYLGLRNSEPVANFALNRGTGGNFTITGSLDAASTSPSG